jgi:hypothetical protein
MPLWKKLYNTIWLAFFSCVLIPHLIGRKIGAPLHVFLGLALLLLTQHTMRQLAALTVPDRLKRISKVTAGIAVFQAVSGLALGALMHFAPNLFTVFSVVRVIHVVCALAILAQASSVATGYDMWEEKEFGPAPAKE